jgi:hypothetical protein
VIGALILGCGNDQSTAPPGQARFSDVQEILSQDCGSCHGAASDRFFKVSMDSAALHQSGLVDPSNPPASLIDLTAANATPHGGGVIASYTSSDQEVVNDWIGALPPPAGGLLSAIRVGTGTGIAPPTVDGLFDPVWAQAPPSQFRVTGGWGEAEFVTLQAAYDESYLSLLVVWNDDQASVRRQPWVKQPDASWKVLPAKEPVPAAGATWAQYMGGNFNEEDPARFNDEDKLAIMWNTYGAATVAGFEESGCAITCHDPAQNGRPGMSYNYSQQENGAKKYTNDPSEIADLWHWKLVRNNHHAKIDDQYVRHWVPRPAGASEGGRASDAGAAGYGSNPALGGRPQYRGPSTTAPPYYIFDHQKVLLTLAELAALPTGSEIPNMITSGPTGTRADVDGKALHSLAGTWGLEIRRKRVTNDVNDVQFDDLTRQYAFGGAIFDNAQIEHRYAPMVARLAFTP